MQKVIVGAVLIFVGGCARDTQLPNDVCAPIVCRPIYGRASDWDVISDDLARNIYRHNRMCEEINN